MVPTLIIMVSKWCQKSSKSVPKVRSGVVKMWQMCYTCCVFWNIGNECCVFEEILYEKICFFMTKKQKHLHKNEYIFAPEMHENLHQNAWKKQILGIPKSIHICYTGGHFWNLGCDFDGKMVQKSNEIGNKKAWKWCEKSNFLCQNGDQNASKMMHFDRKNE